MLRLVTAVGCANRRSASSPPRFSPARSVHEPVQAVQRSGHAFRVRGRRRGRVEAIPALPHLSRQRHEPDLPAPHHPPLQPPTTPRRQPPAIPPKVPPSDADAARRARRGPPPPPLLPLARPDAPG